MKTATRKSVAAFTLVELMIGLVILMLVGGVAYSILMNATTLMAKNISLNASSTTLRAALDRVYSEVNQANGLPTIDQRRQQCRRERFRAGGRNRFRSLRQRALHRNESADHRAYPHGDFFSNEVFD